MICARRVSDEFRVLVRRFDVLMLLSINGTAWTKWDLNYILIDSLDSYCHLGTIIIRIVVWERYVILARIVFVGIWCKAKGITWSVLQRPWSAIILEEKYDSVYKYHYMGNTTSRNSNITKLEDKVLWKRMECNNWVRFDSGLKQEA